jgi:RNA polymerase sigma-70 factor, ECF subfamily
MSWLPDDRQPAPSFDDASLIARVLDGERQQFAPLVERYQAALYRYAVSMVIDHDVAADMVQDAFVRAYTNLSACRDHTRFRAWLFQTLRNRCFDHLKDVRQRNIPLEAAGPLIDPAEGPGARLERVRLRSELRQALARLPDVLREAFLMHYVDGESYDTMAELLDASVSALKMRVLRARGALASDLLKRDVTEAAPIRLSIRRETGETR